MPQETAPDKISELAGRAASYTPPDPAGGKDVTLATVVAVIEILLKLYSCFAENPAAAAAMCRVPIVRRNLLNRALRQVDPGTAGERLATGMLRLGDEITAEDIAAAVNEHAKKNGAVSTAR